MNKFFLNNFKFTNEPINFFKIKIESSPVINKNTNYIPLENNSITIDENILTDLNDLDKDINWISNGEQFQQIINKYNQQIIVDGSLENFIGQGPTDNIMIIGESPDFNDNILESFIGDNKILLKKMLNYINLNLEDAYITTLSYWKPKNNRSLTVEEINHLKKFMEKHIAIINPKNILLLGNTAAQSILEINKPLNVIRGQIYEFNHIPVVVSFNPGFLKRFPNFNTEAKKDMDLFKSIVV